MISLRILQLIFKKKKKKKQKMAEQKTEKKVISAQHCFEPPLSQGALDESDIFVEMNTKRSKEHSFLGE
jgi:ATP-dependent protease HslVU (ClpYQ) ATPase subunit